MTATKSTACDSTSIAAAINNLRSQPALPFDLGVRIALLLSQIPTLVWTHLYKPLDFRNPVPPKIHFAPRFVRALDEYIVQLRMKEGLYKAFPDYLNIDRKERRRQRRYSERITNTVEAVYKTCVIEVFEDLFIGWIAKETQMFNEGVEKVLCGADWYVYPEENVVMEAREGDWGTWLRGRCMTIGRAEVMSGKREFMTKPIEVLPLQEQTESRGVP